MCKGVRASRSSIRTRPFLRDLIDGQTDITLEEMRAC